jgi:hypothetical protein
LSCALQIYPRILRRTVASFALRPMVASLCVAFPGIAASVVIPTRNRSTYLELVLASLEQQLLPRRCWEAVIVDNASQSNSRILTDATGAVTDTLLTDAWGVEVAAKVANGYASIYARRWMGPLSRKETMRRPQGKGFDRIKENRGMRGQDPLECSRRKVR